MPWVRGQPTDPKYRTPEHRRERARWVHTMQQQGHLTCMQPVCVMPTRTITHGETWHLGHTDDGTAYVGPTHARCNVRDGAVRAAARSHGRSAPTRWTL